MSGLLSALMQNVLSWVLGQGIESAGELRGRRMVRGVCVAVVLLLSVWIALASALLWTSGHYPHVTGLWQWVQAGGPPWVLAAPVCAALAILWLLWPGAGTFTLALLCSVGAFACTLAALANFQGGGQYAVNGAAVASGISVIVLPLFALALAMGDVPPLDAPLARVSLVYWGRLGHLRALRAWGARHGWRVSGPAGREATLTLDGAYDAGHPVTVTSSISLRMSSENNTAFSLSVKMGSPYDIVAFRISGQPAPKRLRGRVLAGTSRSGFSRVVHYYVVPARDYPIPEDFMTRLGSLVAAGQPYLGKLDFAHATPFGIRATHKSGMRLTVRDAELEPRLRWMRELCALLEEVSPGPASASASVPMAAGTPAAQAPNTTTPGWTSTR